MSLSIRISPMMVLLVSLLSGPMYAHETDCSNLSLMSETSADVNGDVPDELETSLIDSLLDWVELNTQYDVSKTRQDPPILDFCKVGELIEYEGLQIMVDAGLNAAYDSHRRTINIVGSWNPDSTWDQSILLHELVHDVQLQNREWYCLQQPEWEAYRLQDAWLQQQGMQSGFDWLYIYFLSRCPRDHHP